MNDTKQVLLDRIAQEEAALAKHRGIVELCEARLTLLRELTGEAKANGAVPRRRRPSRPRTTKHYASPEETTQRISVMRDILRKEGAMGTKALYERAKPRITGHFDYQTAYGILRWNTEVFSKEPGRGGLWGARRV